jgi:hypothetical protein
MWIAIFSNDDTHIIEEGTIIDNESTVLVSFSKPTTTINNIKITYKDAHVASIITPFDDCEHIILTEKDIYFQINKKAMKIIEEGIKKKLLLGKNLETGRTVHDLT